jgi:hypothetical protein
MNCAQIEEILASYLENEVSPEEKEMIEGHLKSCVSCSSLLFFMKESQSSLASLPEVELSPNLLDKLYAIPEKKKKFRFNLDFLLKPSLQPVYATATIFLVIFSCYFFHPDRKYINKYINRQLHLGYSQVEKLYAKAGSVTDNLGRYKDNILTSLKSSKVLNRNED